MNREEGVADGEHTGETYTDTLDATCSAEGYIKTYCKACNELLSEETLPINDEHAFHNGTCLLCGKLEVCEHNYVEVKREDATCTLPAYVWYECSECGEEMNREEGVADGEHKYVEVKREDATCTLPAYVWYECSECGEEMNREEGVADGEHNYVDGVCTVCGAADPDAEVPETEAPEVEEPKATVWMPRMFKVTVKVEEGGKVDVKGMNLMKAKQFMIAFGASRTLNITPDEGYEVEDILVNGKSVGALEKYVLKGVSKNCIIEVKFVESVEEIAG